tara:strand:+ start:101 stop:403 length:303 start_codon:yes stop_codon:yes gene_type:complete
MTVKYRQNLGKKDIINNIKSLVGLSAKNIHGIVENIIDETIKVLIQNKQIKIKNFGSFYIIFKNKREGRNPKTKENFLIISRNSIKFKASNLLKKKINEI